MLFPTPWVTFKFSVLVAALLQSSVEHLNTNCLSPSHLWPRTPKIRPVNEDSAAFVEMHSVSWGTLEKKNKNPVTMVGFLLGIHTIFINSGVNARRKAKEESALYKFLSCPASPAQYQGSHTPSFFEVIQFIPTLEQDPGVSASVWCLIPIFSLYNPTTSEEQWGWTTFITWKTPSGLSFHLLKEDSSAWVPMDLYGKGLIYTGRPCKDFQTMP